MKTYKEFILENKGRIEKVKKEYADLKKKSVKELRGIIQSTNKVINVQGFDKGGAISQILRDRHGNKAVDAAFDLDEARKVGDKYTVYKDNKVIQPNMTRVAAIALAKKRGAEFGTSAWVQDKIGTVEESNK